MRKSQLRSELWMEVQSYKIGDHEIELVFRDGVAPASPYSLLLAQNIPILAGQTAVDVGTGSGLLAIVARLQCAKRVYLLEAYDKALALALENAKRNGIESGLVVLPIGDSMLPLPEGEQVDLILSNPAQLALPEPDRANSPFYAGPDGRAMIDALIKETPGKLSPSGRLLMTHNSMANLSKSLRLFKSVGLQPKIVAERSLAFRPFINRDWLDTLGGVSEGLYSVRDGVAHESVYVLEARQQGDRPRRAN
jgi:release factor glutamine methyltransferase